MPNITKGGVSYGVVDEPAPDNVPDNTPDGEPDNRPLPDNAPDNEPDKRGDRTETTAHAEAEVIPSPKKATTSRKSTR